MYVLIWEALESEVIIDVRCGSWQGKMEKEEEEGLVVRGRVVIDMRPPFRSVKDAVMSFGETVLVGEIYGNKLKEVCF